MQSLPRSLLPRTRNLFSPRTITHRKIRICNMSTSTSAPSNPTSPPAASPTTPSPPTPTAQPKPLLALPESASTTSSSTPETTTTKLDISTGSSHIKLDHLGPLVVGTDGTLGRISNWATMTEGERENTVRIIGARNRRRLEGLRGKEGEGKEG